MSSDIPTFVGNIRPDDGDRLAETLAGQLLRDLVAAVDLGELLRSVAMLAVEGIPGCDAASITMIHDGAPATVACSNELALAVDEFQYGDGHGPCLHAARTDLVVQVDDIDTETTPYAWQQAAQGAGFSGSLSMPLPTTANVVAALNLYTGSASGWPERATPSAYRVAGYAADAITLACRLLGPLDHLHHVTHAEAREAADE